MIEISLQFSLANASIFIMGCFLVAYFAWGDKFHCCATFPSYGAPSEAASTACAKLQMPSGTFWLWPLKRRQLQGWSCASSHCAFSLRRSRVQEREIWFVGLTFLLPMRVRQPFHFIMLSMRMILIGRWSSRLGPLNFKCLHCQSDKGPLIHFYSSSKDSSLFLPKFPIRCHISLLLIFIFVSLYNQFCSVKVSP